jgi:hypothetical protein
MLCPFDIFIGNAGSLIHQPSGRPDPDVRLGQNHRREPERRVQRMRAAMPDT